MNCDGDASDNIAHIVVAQASGRVGQAGKPVARCLRRVGTRAGVLRHAGAVAVGVVDYGPDRCGRCCARVIVRVGGDAIACIVGDIAHVVAQRVAHDAPGT